MIEHQESVYQKTQSQIEKSSRWKIFRQKNHQFLRRWIKFFLKFSRTSSVSRQFFRICSHRFISFKPHAVFWFPDRNWRKNQIRNFNHNWFSFCRKNQKISISCSMNRLFKIQLKIVENIIHAADLLHNFHIRYSGKSGFLF